MDYPRDFFGAKTAPYRIMPEDHLMGRRRKSDPGPWTADEDAVLISCWSNPHIDFEDIAELVSECRTITAIKNRGYKIGLGRKARLKKAEKLAYELTPWPDDMPAFDDHPRSAAPGSRSKAARQATRLTWAGRNAAASPAGSTIDGGAIQPTGRRIGHSR